ncbi:MAG: hypothetical protein ABR958_02265 [Dehalococcoidales bacterium]
MGKVYECGWYLVIYLDVLGQSKKLKQFKHLPTNPIENDNLIKIERETAGFIVDFRNFFDDIFNALKNTDNLLNSIPIEKHNLVKTLLENKITSRGISDSYVMTLPLAENESIGRSGVMYNVWAALGATCASFIWALAKGSAIRGGIDIGPGTILPIGNHDEVYGLAVVNAVDLEKRIAQYPRVAMGENLWQYLYQAEQSPANNNIINIAKKYAIICKNLIYQDHDGVHTLDSFGKEIFALENVLNKQLVGIAYKWVVQEHEKYVKSMDNKLAGKYFLLRQYIESRLPIWNISIIK